MKRLLFLGFVLVAACGRKGPPLPPLREVPETTTDLRAHQEESEVVLTWSFPSLTRSGQPLLDLEAVEVWRTEVPPGQEKSLEGPQGGELRRQLLLGRGKQLARLAGKSLDEATRGGTLEYRDTVSLPSGQSGPTLLYAVRSRRPKGRTSDFSNIAAIQLQTPPAPPTNLRAEPLADGVALEWEAYPEATFRVERWEQPAGWLVLADDVSSPSYRDTTAVQGRSYRYRVRTKVRSAMGSPSPEILVVYRDTFPPAAPANLLCLPEPGQVVLRWDPGTEEGVRFKVFRRRGDGPWVHLNDNWSDPSFVDTAPPAGDLTYAVKAFDRAGNESPETTCSARGGP